MLSARPSTIEEYVNWAKATLLVDYLSPATRNRFEANLQIAQNAVQDSQLMRTLPDFLTGLEQKCMDSTGASLLLTKEFTVVRKPFDSAVVKSFRANVVNNKRFPAPPEKGWVTPDNWYGRFDDLVRSTLVCRFLDGPKVVAEALTAHAKESGLAGRHVPRGTDDGYYAFHQYTTYPIDIMSPAFETESATVEFEFQLTTQFQEVLRDLTHPLYEKLRLSRVIRDDHWKWEYDTPRFRTSYLGHTLHMIEAVIVQVRDMTVGTPQPVIDRGGRESAEMPSGEPKDSENQE